MVLFSMQDKRVLITGGSQGIGKGMAKVFVEAGAKVVICGRNRETLRIAATELRCDFVLANVGEWDDVERAVQFVVDKHGGLDVLIANAGIYPQTKLVDLDPREWDDVVQTNLKSSFLCVKAALPHFIAKEQQQQQQASAAGPQGKKGTGGGRIILISSITGPVTGYPGYCHYGATKAGQLGFMRSAALELVPYHVTINAILPGNIVTEGLLALGTDYVKKMTSSVPMQRLGTVDDVAHAALFLASDEAAYITGQQIVVDGGQTLPESLVGPAARDEMMMI